MHSAPAVIFPVGRSRFQRLFLTCVLVAGVAACITWTYSVAVVDWQQQLCFVLLLVVGLNAWRGIQRAETGLLKWNGQQWQGQWLRDSISESGQLVAQLDLQFFMLLEFRADAGHTRWLWLDRAGALGKWLALRRAVYGRPLKGARAKPVDGRNDSSDAVSNVQPLSKTGP